MKKILIIPFIMTLIVIFSFIDCKQPEHQSSKITKHFNSTLDSLSGTWISANDEDYKIVISGRTHYSYYENTCDDTLQIFIADVCTKAALISSFDANKTDGKYLVLYNPNDPDISYCYTISYLSDISLELFYDGKKLSFEKQ